MQKSKSTKTVTTILLLAFGLLASSTLLAVTLFTSVAEAKPATVLLQEGLYAEEIDGDLDAAMKIYEEIIGDKSAQNSCVAKAMYRLGMCHIKRQNEQQAKAVFEKLVAQFPEQTSIVEKVRPLLDKMSSPDPAALMPPDTKIYLELGSPGRQIEKILNMLKGTPFENPLAAIGGGGKQGEKSPGDIMAALLNPSMMAEFKKIRGIAVGFGTIPVNVSNPPAVAVLYLGQSDALRGMLLAGLGMVGKPGEPIEGMQTLVIEKTAGVAYDDEVIIIAQPLKQLTWCVKQYKGVTSEPTLASQNRQFARLSRKSREQNALTIWWDGAATFAAFAEQMARSGQAAKLKLADGIVDFSSIQEYVAYLSIGEKDITVEASIGFKQGHNSLAYDLIRTPNLSRSGFETVPSEAVAVVSFALGELQAGQTKKAQEAVRNLTGLDIGREIFTNIEQVTLFALPPSNGSSENSLAKRFSPIAPCLGLALTSHNPQKTQQLLHQLLSVAGLIADVSTNEQSGKEAEFIRGRYKIGVADNKPAYCYMEQVGRTTVVTMSPEVLEACLSAASNQKSALTAGPMQEALQQLPAETSKLVVVNVAGAIRLADSYLSWRYANPKNPGHRLLGQLAQVLGKTTVYLRTGEQLNSFNVHAGIEQIPPLGGILPVAMQLSQINLQAKARATKPKPSDGAVVGPGTEVQLSWRPGTNAKSHKLYLGAGADELALLDEVTEPTYGKLPRPQSGKTYYWRIDEVQPDGSAIEGDVWSFNTGKLVAWWKFDETSGTKVADSAGSGYDGTVIEGKPIWDPNGKYGGCLDFDETYGISIPKEVFGSVNKAITISVWVNGDKDQPAHSNVILQAGVGERGKPYLVTVQTNWQDSGEVRFKTGRGNRDGVRFNAAAEEWAGRWNHYAFVKDGDKGFQRIYLNGTLVAEEKGTKAPMSGVGAARIGIAPDRFGDQYIGKLDDLRIYNYALSEQEIAALCPTPRASRPEPRNRAVIAPTRQLELSWKPGISAAKHKVYIGPDADKLSLLAEAADPSYETLADIEPDATYYWRVDEVQADSSIVTGDVWSFSIGKLIGWWKFDEGQDNTAQDSSANSNRGTIIGHPAWVAGRMGSALEFDGVDDYVSIGESADSALGGQGTIAIWVKTNDSGNGEVNPYITHCKYGLKQKDFNALEFFIFADTWHVVWSDVNDSFNGDWRHLCGTYDGSELKLYIDGTLKGTTSYYGTIGTENSNITIGAEPDPHPGQYYRGAIDDARIYNYALNEDEIAAICESTASSPRADQGKRETCFGT
ncbi:MAG TPA: LamG-like jellyroll fold domain-containing protein [Sedimentisphaerales bacterium]|nr:LamG-like jellyroll fold domain-containing protein [Sedimentisphaerales bacterium]